MAELWLPGKNKEVGIIYNPVAGTKSVQQNDDLAQQVADRFRKMGWSVGVFGTTADPGSAGRLARQAASQYGHVVSMGGDGQRLGVAAGLIGTETPLGHIPNGTVDVWAKETRTPRDPLKAVDALVNGKYHRIDTGVLNGEPFLLMAGFGMDAKVIHKAHPPGEKKKKRGLGPYMRHTMTTVPFFEGVPADYQSGSVAEHITFLQGWVHNTEMLSHLKVRQCKADDGLHAVTLYNGRRGYQMLPSFFSGALFSTSEQPRTRYLEGEEFTLCLLRPVAVELDGEPRPETQYVNSRVVPASLTVWVPNNDVSIFTK